MTSTFRADQSFLEKREFIIPLALFLLFLGITLPGISWGAPDIWHPDEIVARSIKALYGEWKFGEINFDYPDLPQYGMFWLGRIVLALGYSDGEVLIASRVLSTVLAGLTIVLTYFITRRTGGNIYIAGLSGLFLLCASALTHNARFAHNDTYVTFFVALAILFLVNYMNLNHRAWLYASFFTVGMAASSKYNGITLAIAPVLVYLFAQRRLLSRRRLRVLETLFIGGVLTFLGYAVGTPKALFWMTYYFKRMIPALIHTGNYARQPDSVRGIIGQYANFADGLGLPLFLLFSAAFIWACYEVFSAYRANKIEGDTPTSFLLLFLLSMVALDLPIMISYNYPTRFFLPMIPIFAILAAFVTGEMYALARQRGSSAPSARLIGVILTIIVAYSVARNISVMLLFQHDARLPAADFLKTLPVGTSLEHTYYPPTIPEGHFGREHNYPIHFIEIPGEPLPTHKNYIFNTGEAGLDDRLTDYLVIDGFTSARFKSPYMCGLMQVECDFFKQLETGTSHHYRLLAEFSYSLPPFLPQISLDFVNPEIRVYERIK